MTDEDIYAENEYSRIAESFDGDIELFFLLLKVGVPRMSEEISRACIAFYPDGSFEMIINPKFWKKLTFYEKKFVFAHELLHVYFEHGLRMPKMGDREKANIAADIVDNESLVNLFGFDRKSIRFSEQLCWKDTVFGDNERDASLKNFEHYYQRLLNGEGGQKQILDNHPGDKGVPDIFQDSGTMSKNTKAKIQEALAEMDEEQIQKLKEEISRLSKKMQQEFSDGEGDGEGEMKESSLLAGSGIGEYILSYEYKKDFFIYFKNAIDRWLDTFDFEKEEEQFVFKDPVLELLSEHMLLPSDYEEDDEKFEKNRLWVYIDASGSCGEFVEDFVRVCGGIPEKYFDVEFFSFTTSVADVGRDKKGNVVITQALGGTTFSCIETHLAKAKAKKDVKLPHYVFVLTDGIAPSFKLKVLDPERWHFFLMPLGRNKKIFNQYLPQGVITHDFRDIK